MKFSVLVSNYNYAHYLKEAVQSVLNQSYTNYEIIIVDDGSTDSSNQVIKQLQQIAPEKIDAIFQKNQGQGAAFNTAFKASSGDIIAFLDADDIWLPNKLKQIVDVFTNKSEVVGIMHPLNLIDSNGNVISEAKQGWIPDEKLSDIILKTGNAWYYPPTSGLVYHRSILEQVFPIDPIKWRLCVDGCLVFCTAFLGKVVGLNEVLGSYRIHGSNNHANGGITIEKQLTSQAGIRMTNQYLNEFLDYIGYPEKVNLSRNLSYMRTQYYLQKKWNFSKFKAISKLILTWHFYTKMQKIKYLIRFWIKSIIFLIYTHSKSINC